MDPEVVVPAHVVREPGPELARRAERLAVDEPGLQYPVGRLVDDVAVGAALGRQRPLYAEGLEHRVDLGVVELAAAVRVEHLDVRDGEGGRRERRLDRPGVLPGPGGVADDLPVAGVDEQADVVPRGPDAHADQVAAYMGARRPAAEAARAWSSASASRRRGACTAPIWGSGPRWPPWPSLSSVYRRRLL